jgi:hypothetical protein
VQQRPYKTFDSRKEVIRMLRKLLSLGAIVVVAVSFGVSSAAAKSTKPPAGATDHSQGFWSDGFSDGRFN